MITVVTTMGNMLIFLAGLFIVLATLMSAIRTFVMPRSASDNMLRWVFGVTRLLFQLRLRFAKTYAQRDWILGFYAPISLLSLLPFWLIMILIGFMGMNWALGIRPWGEAFTLSGSSLLTLGFAKGPLLVHTILAFAEATIGLILVAVLIAYLPTMYSAFSEREQAVTLLETRAGSPPSGLNLILRAHQIMGLESLVDFWPGWEIWFADLEESHTSLPALVFFRSPRADRSWVTASGTVLDSAALYLSVLDLPTSSQAALCIRAGTLALRRISDVFRISYHSDPHYPQNPISVTRADFDAVYNTLREQGLPLKLDQEQAWQDFAGWRVNYDQVLTALAALTMAPPAPWSTDLVSPAPISRLFARRRP